MSTVVPHAVFEDIEVSTDGLTADQVLRTFDLLRRRLAARATGYEGASAGYSQLRWDVLPQEGGRLTAEAAPLHSGERWQRVEYRATFRPRSGDAPRVLAVGIGQTVGLRARTPVEA
ncbi:MAG: hypothetical protein ACK4V6_09480 [Microthrixaceae bacterium]